MTGDRLIRSRGPERWGFTGGLHLATLKHLPVIEGKERILKAQGKTEKRREKGDKFMILATIRMIIPPQKRDGALKILRSVVELCKDDPNCLSCHTYEDLMGKNVLMATEVWKSQEDLDRHLRSDEYRNLLLVLEVALEQREIRFDTISSSTGIETIEKARGHTR